jgi:hypothetical protein
MATRANAGLIRTLAVTLLVTVALVVLLASPRARLQPVRTATFELDEPWEDTAVPAGKN